MLTLTGTLAPNDNQESTEATRAEEPTLRLMPGLLVELSGPDARRKAAELLARYPFCPAAWVEKSLEPFPDEVRRERMHFDRVLFVNGGDDSAWALSTFINSGLFPFVVYYAPYGDERFLRKLRRQAKATGTMVILLREDPLPAWQIHYQYRTNQGALELVRGGKTT